MPNRHGEHIWYELMTPDRDAAASFYRAVVGWETHGFGDGMDGYRAFSRGGVDVAGLMATPAQAGSAPAQWFGYVGVDDVDATVMAAEAVGGVIHVPATDIPGIGRFAMMADPHGAMFYVMRGASEEVSTAFAPMTDGHCQWNELAATDPPAAFGFYAALFGWEKGETMPMGEAGDYQLIEHHGQALGALMKQADDRPSAWLFYFGVPDIDAAARAIAREGGLVMHGPAEVPGSGFIVVAADPQGAAFGLVGPRVQ